MKTKGYCLLFLVVSSAQIRSIQAFDERRRQREPEVAESVQQVWSLQQKQSSYKRGGSETILYLPYQQGIYMYNVYSILEANFVFTSPKS